MISMGIYEEIMISKINTFLLVKRYSESSVLDILRSYFNNNKKIYLKIFNKPVAWPDAKNLVYSFHNGWIPHENNGMFYYKNRKNNRIFKIPFEKNNMFSEDFQKIYGIFNYKDKRVLDIGAYIGDTAYFLLSKGARYVESYEPLDENIKLIENNHKEDIKSEKLKVFNYAIGGKTGNKTFYVNKKSVGQKDFGIVEGNHAVIVKVISWEDVLKNGEYDIAKVDCEGGEEYLKYCSNELIRKIPLWAIETHSFEIHEIIKKKFDSAGFQTIKCFNLDKNLRMIYFKRKYDNGMDI